ncbi:MAG TPA: hypothetical protein VIG24_04935 [Acidimicrobiia bacterium]
MTSLIGAALDAPLMSVLARWPDRVHAVEMKQVVEGWDRGTFTTVCGISGTRLIGVTVIEPEGSATIAACWPPRVRGDGAMPSHRERCRECFEKTGRMRPRTEYRARETADAAR